MNTLEVLPYDPSWPMRFSDERARLSAAIGDLALRIDHNGSTAVPGLAAKPVVDIQVSVRSLQPIDAYRAALQRLGYVHVAHEDDARCPFFHRPAQWPHTHHVHVVAVGSEEESRTLAFRDYLREHNDVAEAYGRLKISLAPNFSASDAGSREDYATAKGAFIERITQQAIAAGYPLVRGSPTPSATQRMSLATPTIGAVAEHEIEAVASLMRGTIQPLAYYNEQARRVELAKYTADTLRSLIADDPQAVLVARDGAELIGFCVSRFDDGTVWLDWFGTDVRARSRGVGASLLVALTKTLPSRNAHKIWCDSRTDNATSKSVLERAGYRRIATLTNHWYGQDYFLWEWYP